MASSLLVPAIWFGSSQVLSTVHEKPHFVGYYENVELREEKSKILKDEDGKPLFKTVKRHELLEPRKENREREFEASFNLTNGVVMKFGTKEEE